METSLLCARLDYWICPSFRAVRDNRRISNRHERSYPRHHELSQPLALDFSTSLLQIAVLHKGKISYSKPYFRLIYRKCKPCDTCIMGRIEEMTDKCGQCECCQFNNTDECREGSNYFPYKGSNYRAHLLCNNFKPRFLYTYYGLVEQIR